MYLIGFADNDTVLDRCRLPPHKVFRGRDFSIVDCVGRMSRRVSKVVIKEHSVWG